MTRKSSNPTVDGCFGGRFSPNLLGSVQKTPLPYWESTGKCWFHPMAGFSVHVPFRTSWKLEVFPDQTWSNPCWWIDSAGIQWLKGWTFLLLVSRLAPHVARHMFRHVLGSHCRVALPCQGTSPRRFLAVMVPYQSFSLITCPYISINHPGFWIPGWYEG